MRISDWSSDVCSSDLPPASHGVHGVRRFPHHPTEGPAMKDSMKQSNHVDKAGAAWSEVRKAAFVAMFALLPASAWAQDAIGENGAVCKFFSNINKNLNIASIAVVTIAVIFDG